MQSDAQKEKLECKTGVEEKRPGNDHLTARRGGLYGGMSVSRASRVWGLTQLLRG